MGAMASQITSLTNVYSTVYSDAYQRKHQSSASLAFLQGIHRSPVNSPHKVPVTRKMFPFDDVIMKSGGQHVRVYPNVLRSIVVSHITLGHRVFERGTIHCRFISQYTDTPIYGQWYTYIIRYLYNMCRMIFYQNIFHTNDMQLYIWTIQCICDTKYLSILFNIYQQHHTYMWHKIISEIILNGLWNLPRKVLGWFSSVIRRDLWRAVAAEDEIDGLMQDCGNSIPNALELLKCYSKPLKYRLTLQWRHNGHSVSNHQPPDCLLNRFLRRKSKKTSKLRVTGLCAGNSPGTGEFPAQMASNAENFPFDDVIMLFWCWDCNILDKLIHYRSWPLISLLLTSPWH